MNAWSRLTVEAEPPLVWVWISSWANVRSRPYSVLVRESE